MLENNIHTVEIKRFLPNATGISYLYFQSVLFKIINQMLAKLTFDITHRFRCKTNPMNFSITSSYHLHEIETVQRITILRCND